MNFYINQEITINTLKIQGLTNSSVLQIGSAGMIKPVSTLLNTGGFTKPAPELSIPGTPTPTEAGQQILVPLPAPS